LLPSELIVVWKRKGVISPRYAKLSGDNMDVARHLIEFYRGHVGEKKKVLKEFVGELEDRGFDYRFVRGLSFLLDRRSIFKCDDRVKPVDLRRKIYEATGKLGLPTKREQRNLIIETVASELKVSTETVEESLYADLDSELFLEKFEPLLPQQLLEKYNLSLTQTLLFDSTELSFTASGNWQRIFYTIKKCGLIYDVYKDGKFWVKVDGPASLFKLTRRYGTAIAKLLPVIIANPEWSVEAKILWKYTNEICDFKIESWKHHTILKSSEATVPYDSVVEEDFAQRFRALDTGWLLRREPEPVLSGKQVIIPDFSLEREGIKVYIEIVGFWTTDYLLRKIEKLKKINVDMLVIVNESLVCEKVADLEKHARLNVIYYREKIPLAPILRRLEEAFREVRVKQAGFLKDLPVIFMESVVSFEEFAARIGVSAEAVRVALSENTPQDYIVMSNSLVRKDKLEQIGRKIEEQIGRTGRLPLLQVVETIRAEGVEDTTSTVEALGYKIAWHGISPERAEVFKPENKSS